MKTRTVIFLILASWVALSSCKGVAPHIPFDRYVSLISDNTINDIDVKRANDGAYKLYIHTIDTTFSRKKMLYSTTENTSGQDWKTDTMYLYFIDDYRFYYAKNKADSIDIKSDLNKKARIGIYNLSRKDSKEYVNLLMVSTRVKKAHKYDYGDMELQLKGDTLDFVTLYYPRRYQPRNSNATNQQLGQRAFSPKVIDKDARKIYNSGLKTFESTGMGFHAQWHYSKGEIITKIDGKRFDNVLYSRPMGDSIIRSYMFQDKKVYTEEIREVRDKKKMKSW